MTWALFTDIYTPNEIPISLSEKLWDPLGTIVKGTSLTNETGFDCIQ